MKAVPEARAAEIRASMLHWEQLAVEQDQAAEYAASRGEYAGVEKNRAELYRRTVKSLELELETGQWHCVCCLKPGNRIGQGGRTS